VGVALVVTAVGIAVPPRLPTLDSVVGDNRRQTLVVVKVIAAHHNAGVALNNCHLLRYQILILHLHLHVCLPPMLLHMSHTHPGF